MESRKDYVLMVTAGIVLAVHWTTFMQSIQTSTVAIGTLTFSTFPLFVTFLEPVLFHEKLRASSVVSAFIMLLGVLCIVPEFELGNAMTPVSYTHLDVYKRQLIREMLYCIQEMKMYTK